MSSGVIAHPPGECCTRAFIHEGQASGKIVKIQDIDTYVTEPESGKANGHVVFYFPDVFGHLINNKLVADGFSKEGYLVVMPDYFKGDTIDNHLKDGENFGNGFKEGFDMNAWFGKHGEFCKDFVPKFVSEVQSKYGKSGTKYGCTGYCWGAPYVCDQLSSKGICSAGAFAHPALLNDDHIGNLEKPLLLNCAQTDNTFPLELRRKAVDALLNSNKKFQLQLFQGVEHGFATKGDLNDPWQKYAKEQAFQGTVDWFKLWLK